MIQDQLRDALDTIRVKLQAELDSQITALGEQQTQAIKQARAAAEQDADRKWAARLETAQGEWTARHQSELAAARYNHSSCFPLYCNILLSELYYSIQN